MNRDNEQRAYSARQKRQKRSDHRKVCKALDEGIGAPPGAHIYILPGHGYTGQYNPHACTAELARVDREHGELERIRAFGLALARAVDTGDSLEDLRERFRRGTAAVFRCTLRPLDVRDV